MTVMREMANHVWRRRRLALAVFDAFAWVVGTALAAWFRYDWHIAPIDRGKLLLVIALAIALQWVVGAGTGLYSGRHWTGSLEQAVQLAQTVAVTGVIVFVAGLLVHPVWAPRSVPLTAALIALVMTEVVRLGVRRWRERACQPNRAKAEPVVVFGGGAGGRQLIQSMLADSSSPYVPVAVLDDDPYLKRLRIHGVPVMGTRDTIAAVAKECDARVLVIAVPSADASTVRQISRSAAEAGLVVKILPPVADLLRSSAGVEDLRDLDLTDLLGRRVINTDVETIAGYLLGKRVLITGAGGSIGSELCRQVHRFGPSELIMLDHDESALHGVQLSIYGRALLNTRDVVLADIRELETVRAIFQERRPQVVFHAAALKHLPMLEQYPLEAWRSNVLGTLNLLEAADEADVERFVNISTDKAADPISILGYSKRVAERLTAAMSNEIHRPYLSVRFGNVLGSRGSVLTTFRDQIKQGGPVTVTHPEATRYFMTIPEAVQLVIQAAAIGQPGEALILDMGSPVRIDDVARHLIAAAARPVRVEYTGLRAGEKVHEQLLGDGEVDYRPMHPAISHVDVQGVSPLRVREWDPGTAAEAVAAMVTLSSGVHDAGPVVTRAQARWGVIGDRGGVAP